MAADDDYDYEDCEVVPIPLDRETRRNLVRLAKFVGEQPIHVARKLLKSALSAAQMADAEVPDYSHKH